MNRRSITYYPIQTLSGWRVQVEWYEASRRGGGDTDVCEVFGPTYPSREACEKAIVDLKLREIRENIIV